MIIDLDGISTFITAFSSLIGVILILLLITRVNHVVELTNSNYSRMVELLETSTKTIKEAADRERDRERLDEQTHIERTQKGQNDG